MDTAVAVAVAMVFLWLGMVFRSRAHWAYIGPGIVKVIALLIAGVSVIAA